MILQQVHLSQCYCIYSTTWTRVEHVKDKRYFTSSLEKLCRSTFSFTKGAVIILAKFRMSKSNRPEVYSVTHLEDPCTTRLRLYSLHEGIPKAPSYSSSNSSAENTNTPLLETLGVAPQKCGGRPVGNRVAIRPSCAVGLVSLFL